MTQIELAKKVVKQKIDENGQGSCTVKSKRTGKEYIIAQQYPTYDGWFVYEGCELVVGDVTYDYAIRALLNETR